MLAFIVRIQAWWWERVRSLRSQRGQTTAEYALVILAAAAIALVLLTWARSSDKLPAFFDGIVDRIAGGQE